MTPVLFIAYHFPPVGGAGVQRSQKFVRYLPEQGFRPVVVTGPGVAANRWSPTDEGLFGELSSELDVRRAAGPVPQTDGRWLAKLGRWLFPTKDKFSRWWIQAGMEAAVDSMDGVRLIFATMSPFASAELASSLAHRTGIPWIADLRDPWALDEMQIYPSRFHRQLELHRMERWLSSAAGIVMNTPEATTALLRTFPELKDKPVATITNGYDAADFSREAKSPNDGTFRIVHTGYLHTGLGLEQRRKRAVYKTLGGIEPGVDVLARSHVFLLRAVDQWIGERPEVRQHLKIVFAGVASEPDKAVARDSAASAEITFTGYVSHRQSVDLVRTADLLFLPMHNLTPGKRSRIVPGKTYEYMAAGRPILAAVPEGDARDFLGKAGTALFCRPDDVKTMVRHLDQTYSNWKMSLPPAQPNWEFIKNFERRRLTSKLAAFFNAILNNRTESRDVSLETANA